MSRPFPYDDGAKTMFLYTKGTQGTASQGLRELLKYMEESTTANATNDSLRKIHDMVTIVKQNAEVSREFMKWSELQQMWKDEGILQGVIQTCLDFQVSLEDIVKKLVSEYGISIEEAKKLCEQEILKNKI